jgi:hypothetical protein
MLYKKKRARKSRPKRSFHEYRSEASIAHKRAYERLFGSQGAASSVRKIDPVTGEVIAVINPQQDY